MQRGLLMQYLSQFLIILCFTLCGEALQRLIPLPIPASVYGVALLFAALCLKIIKVEQVKKAGNFLISLLPLMFVGPTVGIAEQWGLIAPQIVPIALLIFSSTVLTFLIAGRVTQWFLKKGGKKDA